MWSDGGIACDGHPLGSWRASKYIQINLFHIGRLVHDKYIETTPVMIHCRSNNHESSMHPHSSWRICFSRRVQRQTRPRLLGKVETGDFGPNFLSLGAMGNVSLKDGSGRVRVQNDLHLTFKVVDWNSYSIVNPWGRQMRSFHLRHLRNKASTDLPLKAARANYFSWGRWRLAGVCLGPFTFPWTLVNSPSKARRIYIWKLLSHPANARAKQRAMQTNCCSF